MNKTCKWSGCGKRMTGTGICSKHNAIVNDAIKENGGITARADEPCSLKGCQRPAIGVLPLCEMHASRYMLKGNVSAVLKMHNNPQTRPRVV